MNETFLIHIEIAGRRYPITIQRDKEEEMRAAAIQINQKILQYQSKYGTQLDTQDMLAMVALQLSVENLTWEDKHDTSPFEDKIRELNDELDKYLKDQ